MSNLSDIRHELTRFGIIPTAQEIDEASETMSQCEELIDAEGELKELYFQQR